MTPPETIPTNLSDTGPVDVRCLDHVALEPVPCRACGRFCVCDGLFAQINGEAA